MKTLKRKKPYIDQLNELKVCFDKLAYDLQNCIDAIDEGDPASARSDLCSILDELKGEEE